MDNQNNNLNSNPEIEQTPVQTTQSYSNFGKQPFMKNKYLLLVISFAALLLIVVFSITFMNINSSYIVKPGPSTNQTSGRVTSPSTSATISSTISQEPTDSPQIAVLKEQVKPQIEKVIEPGLNFNFTAIKMYGDSWATANIYNPNIGGALVILQKNNGSWIIVLGPGSSFPQQQLSNINAPQAMINDINSNQGDTNSVSISPNPSISPL